MSKKFEKRRKPPAPSPAPKSIVEPVWVRPLWYLAAALAAWSCGFAVLRASDLWWHLAAGRWIVARRALSATDPWGFEPGRPWLNHEWLADVLYALWAHLFGLPSLAIWKWGVLVAAFVLLFHLLLRRASPDRPVIAYAAVLLAGLTAAPFLDIRPHLYSLLGFVLVLALTLLPERPSWALPPVFLVWANLHGGFFFGLMALAVALAVWAAFAGGPSAGEPGRRWTLAAGLGAACVLAALLNPYGIEVFLQPLRYALGQSSYVALLNEWLPPFVPGGIRSPWFPVAVAAFLAAAACLFFSGALRRDPVAGWTGLLLGALTLAMALKSRRFIPLFSTAETLPVALALSAVFAGKAGRAGRLRAAGQPPRWRSAALLAVALLIGAVRLAPYPLRPGAFHSLADADTFPADSCNFLNANQAAGKVFADYNWGGYLELCTGGRVDLFIDGRADTVFDEETFRRYLQIRDQEPGWRQMLRATGAQYVLWPKERPGSLVATLETSGEWRRVHEGFVGVLLARRELAAGLTRPAPDSAWRALARGGEAMRAGRMAEAERSLSQALERMPDLAVACGNLAVVQAVRGDASAARRTVRRCQRIFPDPALREDLEEMLGRAR